MDDKLQGNQPPANLPMPLEPETKKDSFSRPTPPPLPPLPPRPTEGFGPLPPRPIMPPPPPIIPSRPSFAPSTPPSVPSRPTLPPSFSIPTPPVSKPSASDTSVRTLKSDLEALKQSPSGMPTAKPIIPPSGAGPIKVEAPKKKSKLLFIIAGILVVGVIAALAGYFVIFPYFFPAQTPPPPTTTPAGTLTPPVQTAPTAQTAPHQSLLKTPAGAQAPLFLASLDSFTAQQTLLSEASNRPAGNDILKEILISDSNGQVAFSSFLPLFLAEFTNSQLNNFENDFTAVIYYDANGFWPIYIAKLKSDADLTAAKNLIKGLETSANLTNLYLENPGTPAGSFKSGAISGIATRYLSYSKAGASLNYAWVGDKLVISASFNGLKRILPSL